MSLKDKLIKAAFGKLTLEIEKYKGFLKKPATLLALKTAAFSLLNILLSQLKDVISKKFTDDEALSYVKNNRDLQKLWGLIGQDVEESYLNEILLLCENPNYYEQDFENFLKSLDGKNLSGEDYINLFNNSDEFDRKTSNYKKSTEMANAISKITEVAPWAFMVYVIGLKIKEFLSQNEDPSPYRGKYLQRLIRIISSILKQRIQDEKNAVKGVKEAAKSISEKERKQIESILKSLKSLDAIIVGSLLASAVYLRNRKLLQSKSLESFREIHSAQLCEMVTEPEIPEIVPVPLNENLTTCPVDLDDNLVPHIPIELSDLSCEIPLGQDSSITEGSQPDIATKALYENTSSVNFNILVKAGDTLRVNVPMATYDGDKVYPTVNGVVEKVEPNKIYVENISDPDQTYLEEVITKMNDAYKELNDTKFFLIDFYIPSWYPVMLKFSPLIDGSLSIQESLLLFYKTGGVKKRWDGIQSDFEKQKKDWDKRNKDIAKDSKVKAKAEAEKMDDIRVEMNQSEEILFKQLKADAVQGVNESKVTKPDEKEFELIEYYFWLSQKLMAYFDKNTIATTMINKISEFLRERYFTDKYSVDKIKSKINNYCKDLAQGTFFSVTPDFYKILRQKWDESNAQIGQRFTAAEDYLKDLQKNNKKLNDTEKTSLREFILFLFNFSIEIDKLIETKYSTEKTKWTETELEGIWIEQFFASLWKRYDTLPGEIEGYQKELDDIARTFTTYSIIVINDEQYRYYSIGEAACEPPEEDDPYLSPKSKKGYGDISYWLRYCSFATLASVANPATSWSTGIPPPIGPIPFPTVYIPIKAFEVNWGFIVVGLTITGIYPFPWALFVNWSTEHHVPLADPATLVKKEVEALKKELSNQLKEFKKERLKTYLDKVKEDIKFLQEQLSDLQNQKRTLREQKPRRDYSVERKIDIPRYTTDLAKWAEKVVVLDELILTSKKDKMQSEIKYKIIKDAYDGAPIAKNQDAKIQALQNTEEKILSQFDKLDLLIAGIDKFLAPLPIATKPETANFAFTVKNPKPIINMATDIDQNINYGPLNKIMEKFEPKNEDLMKTNYGSALSKTFNNFKGYKTALKAAMPTIIKSDPFPKYENLKPSNLPWMSFLLKEWAPTGAKTYGFPGFPPLPL